MCASSATIAQLSISFGQQGGIRALYCLRATRRTHDFYCLQATRCIRALYCHQVLSSSVEGLFPHPESSRACWLTQSSSTSFLRSIALRNTSSSIKRRNRLSRPATSCQAPQQVKTATGCQASRPASLVKSSPPSLSSLERDGSPYSPKRPTCTRHATCGEYVRRGEWGVAAVARGLALMQMVRHHHPTSEEREKVSASCTGYGGGGHRLSHSEPVLCTQHVSLSMCTTEHAARQSCVTQHECMPKPQHE